MREMSEEEKKIFRRLRRAYRTAILGVIKRKGSMGEMREACLRVSNRAVKIGWLEKPQIRTEGI